MATCIYFYFSLDLIRSRKETREKASLNSKLMTEYKNFKAQVCDVVDCKNEKQKSLCPDKCDKGRSFLLTPL